MPLPEDTSIEEDVKTLSDPEPETEETVETPSVEEAEVEVEEEEKEKIEESKPDGEDEEEEEEKDLPAGRVSPKEIKAKFPTIYKEFPDLRRVIAWEHEYAKLFPTLENAREASEATAFLNDFGQKVMNGDTKSVLGQIGKESEEAFEKFVDNFLPSLNELSPKHFAKIMTPYVKGLLRSAQASGDKNYALAAAHLQRFLKLQDLNVSAKDPELDQREQSLKQREQLQFRERVKTFENDAYEEGKTRLMNLIKRDLDPEEVMTPRQREAAARDIFEEIQENALKDERHMRNMMALKKAGIEAGFTREARVRWVSAFLARVKPLVPGIRQKVREDYLGTSKKKGDPNSGKRYIPPSGSSGISRERTLDPKKVDYSKMTDMDILDAE